MKKEKTPEQPSPTSKSGSFLPEAVLSEIKRRQRKKSKDEPKG